MLKIFFFFFLVCISLSVAKFYTRSACHDGVLALMSVGVSSFLSTDAFLTIEWKENSAIRLKGRNTGR